ncbi:MAG: glycosyltransferase, partial [Bacteroidia bacterium]
RIKYIKNESNLGLIKTLNKGIELCEGKYIVRMDADDVSLPKRIQKQVEFMEAHPEIGVAGTEYYSFSETKFKKVRAYTEPEVLKSLLIFKSCLCHPSVIIRKSVLMENNIRFNERYKHVEDYEFWVQLSKVTRLSNVKGFLLKYRTHDAQVSNVHTGTQKDNSEIVRENYLKSLGFRFTEKDLQTNTLIANNTLITSEEKLTEIENWLLKLVGQNTQLNAIKTGHFNFMMGKTWFDSCGITNLGMAAYNRFFKSSLAKYYPLSPKKKVKLLAKCTLRRFKK